MRGPPALAARGQGPLCARHAAALPRAGAVQAGRGEGPRSPSARGGLSTAAGRASGVPTSTGLRPLTALPALFQLRSTRRSRARRSTRTRWRAHPCWRRRSSRRTTSPRWGPGRAGPPGRRGAAGAGAPSRGRGESLAVSRDRRTGGPAHGLRPGPRGYGVAGGL